MLKAEELRIGNILKVENSIIKIGSIIYDRIYAGCRISDLNGKVYWLSMINPIQLTEEILLKVGFEKIPHFTVGNSLIFNLGRDRQLSIGNVGTPNEIIWMCTVDDECNPTKLTDLICVHNFDYDGKMYLHQLQNLTHSVGQELDVTPLLT